MGEERQKACVKGDSQRDSLTRPWRSSGRCLEVTGYSTEDLCVEPGRELLVKTELGHGAGRCGKTDQGLDVGTRFDMEKSCE